MDWNFGQPNVRINGLILIRRGWILIGWFAEIPGLKLVPNFFNTYTYWCEGGENGNYWSYSARHVRGKEEMGLSSSQFHTHGRNPNTCAIIPCLSRHISSELHQNQYSSNQPLMWDAGVSDRSLNSYATMLPPILQVTSISLIYKRLSRNADLLNEHLHLLLEGKQASYQSQMWKEDSWRPDKMNLNNTNLKHFQTKCLELLVHPAFH